MLTWRHGMDLPDRFQGYLPPVVTEILVAAVAVTLAIGARLLIELVVGDVVAFALVFPAVVGAALFAGWRSGAYVIVCGQLLAWFFLLPIKGSFQFATLSDAVSLFLATTAQALMLWFVVGYRNAAHRLVDLEAGRAAELQQRLEAMDAQARVDSVLRAQELALQQTRQNLFAIYNSSADGLTLCRAIKDERGDVVDYYVLEVNDAHRELTGATRTQMLGAPVSQIAPPVNPRWFSSADAALKTGKMQHFDVRSPVTGRWLNIRVSPVSDDQFQQTFVDVSDRHLLDEQRQHLLKEMSHRIANNLQMIANFLHVQAGFVDGAARAQLKTAEGRVHVLAKLHSLLAYAESDGAIDAAEYIGELCEYLGTLVDRPDHIKIEHQCRSLPLLAEKMVPVGFIISELVTNAVKYAFPNNSSGVISVRLAPEEGCWSLSVADNGQGLNEAPTSSAAKARGGLGTRLVQAFVNQLGGELITHASAGVEHVISFVP